MRRAEILALFDYSYWANELVLDAAAELPPEELTRPADLTWRNLRDTLVFALDVERSWRIRLQGQPPERWDTTLDPEDYPAVADIAEHWRRDEAEMRAWLDDLDDETLSAVVDLGPEDRFPLWTFLLHMFTHGAQQRRDAVLLLKRAGVEPPELDFLYYADDLQD
ncbi:MAG: DinB family protein [Actinomycetota bacterium]